MKPCLIEFPDGRVENVSLEAAEFALVIDLTENYPQLAAQLKPALEAIQFGSAGIQLLQKSFGIEKTREMIGKAIAKN